MTTILNFLTAPIPVPGWLVLLGVAAIWVLLLPVENNSNETKGGDGE